MAHFILSRQGYEALVQELGSLPRELWFNAGVLSDSEAAELHAQGISVSRFSNAIDPLDQAALADAVETIEQHHPNERVWVEFGGA